MKMRFVYSAIALLLATAVQTPLALAQTPDAQAPKPVAEVPKGLSYKNINILFGGFLASETVYRNNNMSSDVSTSYGKIPFRNDTGYSVGEFRGSERQSRFSLLAQGDAGQAHLTGYYEFDFLGTSPSANPNQSNSYTPRTRHVYLAVDYDSGWHFLAGQTWSMATLNAKGITPRNEYIPLTIDAQYPVGFNWERQWQMRFVKDWNKTFWAALSFENAQTVGVAGNTAAGTGNTYQLTSGSTLTNGDTGSGANAAPSVISMNSYPDLIAKFAYQADFGHFEVYNLMRNFESRYGGTTTATQTHRQNAWTDAVGAGVTIPVAHILDISLSGLFGKGIGRYGTSQLADATYASNGSLKPLDGTQYLGQIVWHATGTLDAYLTYGHEEVKAAVGSANAYGYGNNMVTSLTGCDSFGGTCKPELKSINQANVGAWWSFYKGDYGLAKLGGQYSHTTLNTFADAGGRSPSTSEDMVFTSLRYYPF